MKTVWNPFEIDPSTAPDHDALQLEIINIQSYSDLKMTLSQNDLLFMPKSFYKNISEFNETYS